MIVYGHHIGDWVAHKIEGIYSPLESQAIGWVSQDGRVLAGAIFEDWNRASLVCHIATDGRMSREFLKEVSTYAFIQCKVHKMIAPVASSNHRSERMVRKMGFIEEGRLRNAHPHGDVVLYTLTREDCRFLGERYGKKCSAPAYA